jgi:hypothetical protein
VYQLRDGPSTFRVPILFPQYMPASVISLNLITPIIHYTSEFDCSIFISIVQLQTLALNLKVSAPPDFDVS